MRDGDSPDFWRLTYLTVTALPCIRMALLPKTCGATVLVQRGKLGCADEHGPGLPPCSTKTASPASSGRSESLLSRQALVHYPCSRTNGAAVQRRGAVLSRQGLLAWPLPIRCPNPVDSRRPAERRIRTHFAFTFTALARKVACRLRLLPTPHRGFEFLSLRKQSFRPDLSRSSAFRASTPCGGGPRPPAPLSGTD
jgi:hypothetical protein